MASGFGQQLVREQIEFGVWAIDHEDPRHRAVGCNGVWPRTKYAIVHTFVARRDDGGQMPAYSRFIGDYGAGFVSREWYPAASTMSTGTRRRNCFAWFGCRFERGPGIHPSLADSLRAGRLEELDIFS